MAARIKPPADALYESDFYAWAKAQAALLRAGRVRELDLDHLSLEVEDLGDSLYRSARSRMRTIMEHLLKLEHSPAQDPPADWADTIDSRRADLGPELTPVLRRRLESELPGIYADARKYADRSLRRYGEDAAADALPATCPYSFEQITGDWLP